VGKEKNSLFGLQEFSSLQKIQSLQVYEVLDDNDGILKIKSCGFLNFKLLYDALQGFQENFMDTSLVTSQSDLCEKVMRRFRNVKGELIGHTQNKETPRLKEYL
jgi:hypothetical protein